MKSEPALKIRRISPSSSLTMKAKKEVFILSVLSVSFYLFPRNQRNYFVDSLDFCLNKCI